MTKILGRKWFYYLKKKENNEALEDHIELGATIAGLIVCYQLKHRLYSHFDSIDEFKRYSAKIGAGKQHFYEVVLNGKQKPHFDVDIDLLENPNINDEEVMAELLSNIVKTMEQWGGIVDPDKDILLFQSHGKFKKSYHIVIDNFYHNNNIDAGAFYDDVVKEMNPIYTRLIDDSVYKRVQQFRMLGSCKWGTERYKIHIPKKDYKPPGIFELSIISFVDGCVELKPPVYNSDDDMGLRASKEVVVTEDEIEALMVRTFGERYPFEITERIGNLITMKRIFPSECVICQRTHEHENPFITINSRGDVTFYCRRSEGNKGYLLGCIFIHDLGIVPTMATEEVKMEDHPESKVEEIQPKVEEITTKTPPKIEVKKQIETLLVELDFTNLSILSSKSIASIKKSGLRKVNRKKNVRRKPKQNQWMLSYTGYK